MSAIAAASPKDEVGAVHVNRHPVLPTSLPYRRSILKLAKEKNLLLLPAAALLGREVLLPYLQHLIKYTSSSCELSFPLEGANEALQAAVYHDCPSSVEALILGAGADPFQCVYHSTELGSATATHMAAARGRLRALETILRLDPDKKAIDVLDATGMAPIHAAAGCGHMEAVRMLVRHDMAALSVQVHRIQGLTFEVDEEGVYIQDSLWHGMDEFSAYGEMDYKMLLLSTAGLHHCGETALYFAAGCGHIDVVRELLRLTYEAECGKMLRTLGEHRPVQTISISDLLEEKHGNGSRKRRQKGCTRGNAVYTFVQRAWLREREGNCAMQTSASVCLQDEVSDFVNELVEVIIDTTTSAQNGRTQFHSIRVDDVLEVKNTDNSSLMAVAAASFQPQAVDSLISHGAYTCLRDVRPFPPHLQSSVIAPLIEILAKDHNVDVNVRDEQGCTALHLACNARYCSHLQTLLQLGADHSLKTYWNETPLYIAALWECEEAFKKLLDNGADPNVTSTWDVPMTPAQTLVKYNNFDLLLYLIAYAKGKGIALNLDHRYGDGVSILGEALDGHAHVGVVEALISAGAEIDVADQKYGWTPLMVASESGTSEIVRMLLEAGANPNTDSTMGWRPIHIATEKNSDIGCMKALIDYGADVNVVNGLVSMTPLLFAIRAISEEKVQLLLSAGANSNYISYRGKTPLHLAAEKGSCRIAKMLLDAGADPRTQDDDGATALHCAACRTDGSAPLLIDMLVDAGCPKEQKEDGMTALHLACVKEDRSATMYRLLAKGADVNATDSDGRTPIFEAAAKGFIQNVCALIEHRANIFIRSRDGEDPLLYAAAHGSLKVLATLHSHGARLDSRDSHGHTAVHHAASNGHASVVRYLLKNGVDITDIDGDSGFARVIESASRYPSTLRLLLHYNSSFLNSVAPRSICSANSPCASSDELDCAESIARREERHLECEMDRRREDCAICRGLLRNGDSVRTLLCQHSFHDDCLLAWFTSEHRQGQFICPLCRQRLWNSDDVQESESFNDL